MADEIPGGFAAIMEAAKKMQGDMTRMQEELGSITCEGSSGGGMVRATVNGKYEVLSIDIEKEVIDPTDASMLQDLIVAAVNQAIVKIREKTESQMSNLAGGLNIPGLKMPF